MIIATIMIIYDYIIIIGSTTTSMRLYYYLMTAGRYCETNIDDCIPDPCLNGGSCSDRVDEYVCGCAPEYVGANCSDHVCDIHRSPCLNGGTCYVQGNLARCLCPLAFSGDACELDKCLDITCLNEGTCENGICHCRPGKIQ